MDDPFLVLALLIFAWTALAVPVGIFTGHFIRSENKEID